MNKLKLAMLALGIVPLLGLISTLQFYLPSTRKVQLVGTEVKRMDAPGKPGAGPGRDVRFIIARDPGSGETLVYRNEDTRWGWPPYFKFNSGDLSGHATNIKETQPNATVLLTYYGWRVPMADAFPNVVDVEIVDPKYTHLPLFNVIFLTLLFGGGGFGLFRLRRGWRGWRQKRRLKRGGSAVMESRDETELPTAPDAETTQPITVSAGPGGGEEEESRQESDTGDAGSEDPTLESQPPSETPDKEP